MVGCCWLLVKQKEWNLALVVMVLMSEVNGDSSCKMLWNKDVRVNSADGSIY